MKKKQYLQIGSLILILIFLVIGYKYIRSYNRSHANTIEEETLASILNIKQDDIKSISYTNNNSTLCFIKTNNIWQYTDNTGMNVSQNYIGQILNAVSKLTPLRKISDQLTNLSDYGLDQPSLILTLTLNDGSTQTIYIGNKNDMTDNYYCYLEGQNSIYTVSSTFSSNISFDLSNIEETTTQTVTTE